MSGESFYDDQGGGYEGDGDAYYAGGMEPGDGYADDYGFAADPVQEQLEHLQRQIDWRERRSQETSEDGVDLTFGLSEEEVGEQAEAMEQEFPELSDTQAAEQLLDLAERHAFEQTGDEAMARALSNHPGWLRDFYLSFRQQGGKLEPSADHFGDQIVAVTEKKRAFFET